MPNSALSKFVSLLSALAALSAANTIHVAPTGVSGGMGTIASPLDVHSAVTKAASGDTILVEAGTYQLSTTIAIDSLNSGEAAKRKYLLAKPGTKPVFNFSGQAYASENRGILLKGSFWSIVGLEICNAGDNGMKIEGSHNRIERCVFHHNGDGGIQLGFAHQTVNPGGALCAYNEIVNCDSYANFDWGTLGGNADGFACKMHNGKGNVFKGCRAWHNSDDGWDLYETDWPVEITECWSWHNGDQTDFNDIYLAKTGKKMSSFSGNGNGIKLGGNGTGGNSKGQHVVKRCVAFNNRFKSLKGFDQNSHAGGIVIHNSTAWNNGYNFMFETEATTGSVNEFSNNVSFAPKSGLGYEFTSGAILRNNNWGLAGIVASAADFQDTTEISAMAARNPDGSLPSNGFARLVAGSDLVDKGVDVGLTFSGKAPDLGAYEFEASSQLQTKSVQGSGFERIGRAIGLRTEKAEAVAFQLFDASGSCLRTQMALPLGGIARADGLLQGLPKGIWIVRATQQGMEPMTERAAVP
ncbi:MAG: hypothetical protein RL173_1082 [Fibrobacterota bacterium]